MYLDTGSSRVKRAWIGFGSEYYEAHGLRISIALLL